jgi:hypothetical protein
MNERFQGLIAGAKRAGATQVTVVETVVTIVFGDDPGEVGEERHHQTRVEPSSRSEIEIAAEQGEALRFGEWARLLPSIGANELERAVKEAALKAKRIGHGAAHNAKVIDSEAMTEYVRLCSQVQSGEIPPPEWWSNVRKGNNAIVQNERRDGSRGAGSPPYRKVA